MHQPCLLLVLLSIVFPFLILSCREDRSDNRDIVSLQKGEVILDHEDLILSWPPAFMKTVGRDSLLTYDEQTHRFTLFSLRHKKPVWSDSFELSGPDFIEQPILDAAVQGHELILLSPSFLMISDMNGAIKKRIAINGISGGYSKSLLRSFIARNKDKLIFPKLLRAAVSPADFTDTTSTIFLEYDLPSGIVRDLPIPSPPETLIDNPERGFYNHLAQHNSLLLGDNLYYNFQFSSSIYRYNLTTQQSDVFQAKTRFTHNRRSPINKRHSPEELIRYQYSGAFFLPLLYDETSGYFIRLHSQFHKASDGTDVLHKYIMIFDKKFNCLAEIEVPHAIFEDIQVDQGTLYLWKLDPETEHGYELITYTIMGG